MAKWVDNFGGIGAYSIAAILVISAGAALLFKGSATKFHAMPNWEY